MPQAETHDESYELRERAAAFLEENLEDVFRRWERQVVKEVPAAVGLGKPLLRNHLAPHMRMLAQLLRSPTVAAARTKECYLVKSDVPTEETHGRLRATLPGYSVDQLIDEYIILRQVIADAMAEQGLLTADVLDILALTNDRAIAGSAAQFTHSLEILKERAISMLMHDIRNPLNVISLTTEAIRKKQHNRELEQDIDTLRSNVARIDRMVTELLDAVRLGAGEGLELQFKNVDLRQVLIESTDGAKLSYPERVEVSTPEQSLNGWFDPSAISRAVENLLSNGIKYGAAEKKIRVELRTGPDHHIISVRNWGKPIAENQQAKLFVTFARGEGESRQYQERGWGLGLAYVKAVAEGHGGSVQVHSSHERGTTFSILLPRDWSPDRANHSDHN